jgi:DNA replicative helicase MCM subunit Mcm2 (Cdc46/Mcm family)
MQSPKVSRNGWDVPQGRAAARQNDSDAPVVPITVRQLEAVVRIAESFARMQLQPVATEAHVRRALDLFTVSTMDAVKSGVMEAVVRATSPSFLPPCRGLKGSAGGLP